MSAIRNEAKMKFPLIVAIREQLEHRALLKDEIPPDRGHP